MLHVLLGNGRCHVQYLTEDAEATWETMQQWVRLPERIHQGQGAVWVGSVLSEDGVDDLLAEWGERGCRIGNFLLFGDEHMLRRIREACRSHGGR